MPSNSARQTHQGNIMTLITKHKGYEIWAEFDQDSQTYELFFDQGETYAGWRVDSIKDAHAIAKNIILEHIG
jgi:hypothetical protein